MPFSFENLELPGLVSVTPKRFSDDRGYFAELYKMTDFAAAGIAKPFVQVNRSRSCRGVLRGLHFQAPPMAQAKLVMAVSGEIFDVAVDVRKGSPTFGRWAGIKLDAEKMNMLFVPEGFAHGFCVISASAEVEYFCTNVYSPEHERGIIYNDPSIGIDWPGPDPVLSPKDTVYPVLAKVESGFTFKKQGG